MSVTVNVASCDVNLGDNPAVIAIGFGGAVLGAVLALVIARVILARPRKNTAGEAGGARGLAVSLALVWRVVREHVGRMEARLAEERRVEEGQVKKVNDTHKEMLYATYETHVTRIIWVKGWTWENNTDAPQTYTREYTTGLEVTSGSTEVADRVGILVQLKGLSIDVDGSRKTFSKHETGDVRKRTRVVVVAPRTRVMLYQRAYEFRMTIDAGGPRGDGTVPKECTVQILSDDYLTTHSVLSSAGESSVETSTVVESVNDEGDKETLKHEN